MGFAKDDFEPITRDIKLINEVDAVAMYYMKSTTLQLYTKPCTEDFGSVSFKLDFCTEKSPGAFHPLILLILQFGLHEYWIFCVSYCADLTKVRGVSRCGVVFAGKQLVFPTRTTWLIYTSLDSLTRPLVVANGRCHCQRMTHCRYMTHCWYFRYAASFVSLRRYITFWLRFPRYSRLSSLLNNSLHMETRRKT